MPRQLKEKQCLICGVLFQPTGSCAKYCVPCQGIHLKEYHRKYMYARKVASGEIQNPGVGSGGLTGRGKANHMYRDGLAIVKNYLGKQLKEERRYCEACRKDLLSVNKWQWCIHHKDHDQSNNEIENLMLLCKRCHQIHHQCFRAFEGSTTRDNPSRRTQASSKRRTPDQRQGEDIV
jgi:hypothetical protein